MKGERLKDMFADSRTRLYSADGNQRHQVRPCTFPAECLVVYEDLEDPTYALDYWRTT